MKKKNVLMIALSLCLAAVIAVGGTLAYFTSNTDQKQNAFTTGNVKIELVDESPAGKVDPEDSDSPDLVTGNKGKNGDITYDDVMPGDVISKKVGVNLDANSEPAWIAIKVDVRATPAEGSALSADAAKTEIWRLIDEQVDKDLWKKVPVEESDSSAIYYLKDQAEPEFMEVDGKKVPVTNVLFDRLSIPGNTWGNEYADITFSIDVQAFAVQAKNLTGPMEENSTAVTEILNLIGKTPSAA